MHNKRFYLLCVCLAVLLAACSPVAVSDTVPAETSPPASGQSPLPSSPQPAPTAKPSPAPSGFIPDTGIPGAVPDPQTMAANTNHTLYEDADNIYYLDKYNVHYGGLYSISKTDKSVKLICGDCSAFTLSGSKIYCVIAYSEIIKYEIKTGKKARVKEFDEQIYYIACSGNKIYFTKESAKKYNDEQYHSSLYSCSLDGAGLKQLVGGALSFCIYKNKLYYVKPAGEEEGGEFFVYDIKTRKSKATGTDAFNGFETAYGKTYHNNNEEYDIASGKNKEFVTEDYIMLGLCGQYVIYTYADDDKPSYLYAYDVVNNNKYSLADLSSLGSTCDMAFYTGINCVYIEARGALYCLRILNGRADIEKTASLNNSN